MGSTPGIRGGVDGRRREQPAESDGVGQWDGGDAAGGSSEAATARVAGFPFMRAPPKELIRFLQRFDPATRELALEARELVLRVLAPSHERVLDVYVLAVNYGFSERMKDQAVYIGVYTNHINIGFHWGARMDDPERVLEGSGKRLRHIKIRSQADLGAPFIRDYLQRAVPEGSTPSKTVRTKICPSRRTAEAGKAKLGRHSPFLPARDRLK